MTGPKITFIGAGSTVFAKNLLGDIFSQPSLQWRGSRCSILTGAAGHLGNRGAQGGCFLRGQCPPSTATTDAGAALDGADYVLSMIQVGGYKPAT